MLRRVRSPGKVYSDRLFGGDSGNRMQTLQSSNPEHAESEAIVSIRGVSKTYATGFHALERIDLDIRRGEIFALLGPNGAGKTTLIGIICGIVNATTGRVTIDGHDNVTDYRAARSLVGLVPQELTTDAFESVWGTVSFSRGLFGKGPDPAHDEPTAGVDVNLRRDMWQLVRRLRESGVTIILTTHYIDEAEEMADRIGVIRKGEIILVEDKVELMRKLGQKQLTLHLQQPLAEVPVPLAAYRLALADGGNDLVYTYDSDGERGGIASLLQDLDNAGIHVRDLKTDQKSLEDIFVGLVREEA